MKFTIPLPMFLFRKGYKRPDYQLIKKNITDEDSDLYYPKLLNRYFNLNSYFSLEESRHLYYGYVFSKKYKPYKHDGIELKLNQILKKPAHDETDLKKIVAYSNSMMHHNPFDINAISALLFAYDEQGDKQHYQLVKKQLATIWITIINSGNGLTAKTAFHVLYVSHEYLLLDLFDIKYGGKQSLIDDCDYLTTIDETHDVKGVYFNFKTALNHSK